jgi:AraC family transcriptional regulator
MQEKSPSVGRRLAAMSSARNRTTAAWPVRCEEFAASARYSFSPHAHHQPHACFVIGGALLEHEGTGHRRMAAGTARLSPAGDEHRLSVSGSGVRCLVLSVAHDFIEGSGTSFPEERVYVDGPAIADLARRFVDELRVPDDVSPVCLELLALEAAALNANPHRLVTLATPGWLERVRDRVRDDTRAVPTLAELASDAGVSRAHLARMFRARFGCTIGQYVRGQRLEVARRLILRTETPLSAVAFEAGFADQSHMTRSVTMRFGAPPGRLRAQRRSA